MSTKKSQPAKKDVFSPAETRAARASRIRVREAEPYGWIAYSESDHTQTYHLFRDPHARRLVCTCADFIFRGEAEPNFECKHVSAALKFIGRLYLAHEYDPRHQQLRAA